MTVTDTNEPHTDASTDAPTAATLAAETRALDLTALDAALEHLTGDDSVLRLSESEAEARSGYQEPTEEGVGERMIMNMGPQHPSTHGVLRLVLEMDGELITRSKPVIGYLHTGMEKTAEELTYLQGPTNVTRMDYASPLFSELVFSLATEKLLGIEVPERAQWIRMLLCEVNRLSSHMLFMATNGMDLGAVGMMLYGWREREETLRFLEMVTGLRMNHNFIRPGGVAADLPDGWRQSLLAVLEPLPDRLEEFDTLMTGQPIWRERLQGVGAITTEEALSLGATGPILRSTGYAWDLRRDEPYLRYSDVEFDVAITAVVLGGTSIFGGIGTVHGTLLGLAVLAVLKNGLTLSDMPSELAGILTGALLLCVLAGEALTKNLSRGRKQPAPKPAIPTSQPKPQT